MATRQVKTARKIAPRYVATQSERLPLNTSEGIQIKASKASNKVAFRVAKGLREAV